MESHHIRLWIPVLFMLPSVQKHTCSSYKACNQEINLYSFVPINNIHLSSQFLSISLCLLRLWLHTVQAIRSNYLLSSTSLLWKLKYTTKAFSCMTITKRHGPMSVLHENCTNMNSLTYVTLDLHTFNFTQIFTAQCKL